MLVETCDTIVVDGQLIPTTFGGEQWYSSASVAGGNGRRHQYRGRPRSMWKKGIGVSRKDWRANVFLDGKRVKHRSGQDVLFIPLERGHHQISAAYKIIIWNMHRGGDFPWEASETRRDYVKKMIEIQKTYFENGLSVDCDDEAIRFKIKFNYKSHYRGSRATWTMLEQPEIYETYGYRTQIAEGAGGRMPEELFKEFELKMRKVNLEYGIIREGEDAWAHASHVNQHANFNRASKNNFAYADNKIFLIDVDLGLVKKRVKEENGC